MDCLTNIIYFCYYYNNIPPPYFIRGAQWQRIHKKPPPFFRQ